MWGSSWGRRQLENGRVVGISRCGAAGGLREGVKGQVQWVPASCLAV